MSLAINTIISLIKHELERAQTLHPKWPTHIVEANSIIQEETGEITKAVNDYFWGKGLYSAVEEEVIHSAAMCIRFLLNKNSYHTEKELE